MRAIAYSANGSADVLQDVELPMPTPSGRDLRVAVKAIAVNPVDFKVRSGMPPSPGEMKVIGYDASGVVDAVGPDVVDYKIGDEVYYSGTIDRPGTNAEFHLVDERIVGHKPKSLDFAAAAALPLTAITAWELLFEALEMPYGVQHNPGTLLVINGAGGVGSMLVQLARRLTGATVVATASRPETREWVTKLGAHHVINHRNPLDQEFLGLALGEAQYVAALTDTPKQVEAIANLIEPRGRLAVIDDDDLVINPLKPKSVKVAWEMVFTRPLFKTADMAKQQRILNDIAQLVDAGLLTSTKTEDFGPINAENLRRAHQKVEAGKALGKIVLSSFS